MKHRITDETYFALLEGQLPESETTELMNMINADPALQAEWELWQLTIQSPNDDQYLDKGALFSITETNASNGIFWYRIAGVAALFILGIISVWMLSDMNEFGKTKGHINQDSIFLEDVNKRSKVNEDTLALPELDAMTKNEVLIKKETKMSKKGLQDKSKNKTKKLNKSGNPSISNPDSVTKVRPVEADSMSHHKVEKVEVAVSTPAVEMVYGSPISKNKKRFRKWISWRNQTKGELRKWVEQPRLGFAESNGKKKGIELKNQKFKIGLKP